MSKRALHSLRGGDRRSIGRANAVAAVAAGDRRQFAELIQGLWDADEVVRMRAADAAEKASRERAELLAPYKAELLGLLAEATQQELRWHLAQMISRLPIGRSERKKAAEVLKTYLDDRSSIVRTFAMQALADMATADEELRQEVTEIIQVLTKTGSAAMRARGRKLLKQLERA